ncbi:MAG: hypothetical protein WBP79_05835, partial [Candidatus Acidiferrales bacterium]
MTLCAAIPKRRATDGEGLAPAFPADPRPKAQAAQEVPVARRVGCGGDESPPFQIAPQVRLGCKTS